MRRTSFLLMAIMMLLSFSGCEKINNLTKDVITTLEPTNVTWDDVFMQGWVDLSLMKGSTTSGFIVSFLPDCSPETGTVVMANAVNDKGIFTVLTSGLAENGTLYYRAYVNDGKYRLGDVRMVKTPAFDFGAVDLGLNVKWANANVGADSPYNYGSFYAWGEYTGKLSFTWGNYKWGTSAHDLKKYNGQGKYGVVDNKTQLDLDNDAAHFKHLGDWRMPTETEVKELFSHFKDGGYLWEWKTYNGHSGYKVTYRYNGNSIFLPASGAGTATSATEGKGEKGYYWASTLSSAPYAACCFTFENGKEPEVTYEERYRGFTVRAVTE